MDEREGASSSSMETEKEMDDRRGAEENGPTARFSPSQAKESVSRSFYAKQLVTPEWMVDIPADLRSNW
eukprot:478044-Prorocentrum_minimum.AAC.2